MILTFAYTVSQYATGNKTATRRFWKKAQIEAWQRAWDQGRKIHKAYDRSPRNGGKPINGYSRFVLTQRPFEQPLNEMTPQDLIEEGGMCESVTAFCALVRQPEYGKACVIKFRALPD